jgi:acetolactate synthase-1/2/3 large subunit
MHTDPDFHGDLVRAAQAARQGVLDGLGPYDKLVQALQNAIGRDFNWVRDVTLSNSIWGNRLLPLFDPRAGVHALGGGIGQGLAMGIGAAVGAAERSPVKKTLVLAGDGGFILNVGELATAVQERANMLILLMNDRGYGVIKNIQDAHYGGRRHYVDLHTPDYGQMAGALGLPHARVSDLATLPAELERSLACAGPFLLEIDMVAIGGFKTTFAGPPVRKPLAA